jgi:hypothetical protein
MFDLLVVVGWSARTSDDTMIWVVRTAARPDMDVNVVVLREWC